MTGCPTAQPPRQLALGTTTVTVAIFEQADHLRVAEHARFEDALGTRRQDGHGAKVEPECQAVDYLAGNLMTTLGVILSIARDL